MFRRKPRSKTSFLSLYSSNRGSDIKKPDNTSLIVNESDTESDALPKELTSIFSEDEDENLGGTVRNSSILHSLSQKTQSTPLSRTSQKKNDNIRSQKNRKSNSQNVSYFDEVLKACGAVPLAGDSSFQLSQDQAVFSIKVSKKLKENTDNLKKFMDSIKEKMKDYEYLQKMLAHTLTAENCEVARGPVQEPLMRMLLNVDCLQGELVELLLNIIADLVMDNKRAESENVQLVSSILRQLRFLSGLGDIKIGSKLFEIIDVASFNVKREIIFLLPEIISEEETEDACIQLIELLKFDEMLSRVIIDSLANLPLNNTVRNKVCSKILLRLDKCPVEFLPSFVQFVLNKSHSEEFIEVINGLRNNLPFSPQHSQIKEAENNPEKSDEDSFIKLTFENIKFSVMASKELTDAWIKVIHNLNSAADFRCVDLIMLIIFYSCLFGRKTQILQLIRNKIKSGVITHPHVQNMFKILVVITQEYSSAILEMASSLLKSFEGKISSVGALLYKGCFVYFHAYMKPIVISEILLHVGTGAPFTVSTALNTLRELCQTEKKSLSHHTTSIMGLLVKVQDLELDQVRLLMDVIADLVFFESDNGSAAEDELQIFIRKLLISSKVEHSKKGVSAAIMFGKHSLKEGCGEEGDYTQINSLLELAMGSNGTSDTKRGFFNDEFATMARESKSHKSFLKIWSEKTFNLVMKNLFVKDLEIESNDFPMSVQHTLDAEDVEDLVFPIVDIVIKSHDGLPLNVTVPVIPSTLRLLWCLEGNLIRTLPVFCASVIMPEMTVYDDFNSFDDFQKRKIMDCLFLCGNYLIECVNALCAYGVVDKAIVRLKQLVSVRKLIAKFINQMPGFVPQYCQFYAPTQKVVVKKKSEKKPPKGRKRKYPKDGADDSSSQADTQHTPDASVACSVATVPPPKQSQEEADLHVYFGFFRELDFVAFNMLKASKNSKLDTSDILFLLEDLIYKSEEILKSPDVPFSVKTKSVALLIRKMPPEDFITISVKLLPQLLNKIETFSKYSENLLEANDWILDSHGLYVEGASDVKLAMASGLKFICEIISWRGFQTPNCKLFKEFLTILTKKETSRRGNTTLECFSGLATDAAKYLAKFSKTVMLLSGGLSIVKSFLICLKYSSTETSIELADLCQEFLSRNWYTVTGALEKGPVYNQHIEFLLKTYFNFVEDKLEVVRATAKTAFDEVGGLSSKDSTLKTFKTINKSNFPLLYRTICEALVTASTKELPKSGTDSDQQLNIWNKIVDTLMILVETAKIHPSRIILASLLKRSQSIIQLFLSKGMPMAATALRIKSVEVLKLLKSFQIVTRFLHSICCQSRITNDSVVAAHVPSIRALCERLTFEVKGMLILNGIPMDCITIGVLKNRDIKGNDIISQETLDANSDDDSEIPPEDTPFDEEGNNENFDVETQASNSESY